jgi:hypothetical protein
LNNGKAVAMASVSFTEKDYQTLFGVVIDLQERGEVEDAAILDKLAQKMNIALSRGAFAVVPRSKHMDGTPEFQAPSPLESLRKLGASK